jgi:hypothetical protein
VQLLLYHPSHILLFYMFSKINKHLTNTYEAERTMLIRKPILSPRSSRKLGMNGNSTQKK